MDSTTQKLSLLLKRYINKDITETELDELSILLDSIDPEEVGKVLQEVYEHTEIPTFFSEKLKSELLLANILRHDVNSPSLRNNTTKRKRSLFIMLAAASIAAILLVSNILFSKKNTSSSSTFSAIKDKQEEEISPGGNKAFLKMADGTSIVLNHSPIGILTSGKGMRVKKIADGQLVFDAQNTDTTAMLSDEWNTVSTPRGGQYQLVLPDGSKVWLNAESALRFPSQFAINERRVELIGEAYFEIAKNTQQVFKVVSKDMEVQVLGTNFNLNDYEGSTPKTTLIDGSVKIKSGQQTQVLKPGQQAILRKRQELILQDNIDIDSEIAWKDGLFLFKDASIQKVMNQVARWYDIEIVYEHHHSQKLFNGSVSRNVNLSELMNMLAYTGVHYEIQGRKVLIKN